MIYEVHKKIGVSFDQKSWKRFRCFRGEWRLAYACEEALYALDYAALQLRSEEAFIIALSAMTYFPMQSFDERAVRKVIRRVNEVWEFEAER